METTELKAGREIDSKIAEYLGRCLHVAGDDSLNEKMAHLEIGRRWCTKCNLAIPDKEFISQEGWSPLRNIEHAWEAVEKVGRDGHFINVESCCNEKEKWFWCVTLVHSEMRTTSINEA